MANPKRRHSKSRTNMRRSNWRIKSLNVVKCSNCGEPNISHRVCSECGYYNGKKVMGDKA